MSAQSWLRRVDERLLSKPLLRRLLKNSGYLFSAAGIAALLAFVQNILTARLLGPEGLGVLTAITAFASVINKFVSFRMGELVIKYVGQYSESGDTPRAAAVFKAAALAELGASLLAFGLLVLLAPLGARYLAKDPALSGWFILYGLILLANLVAESSTGLLQIFDRFRRLGGLTVFQGVVTLVLIAVAYRSQGGLSGVVVAYLVGKVIGALGLTIVALQEATRHWGAGWQRQPLSLLRPQAGELAHFAINTSISASLSVVNKDAEPLLLSFLRGPLETGFYKQALGLINLVQMPIDPLPKTTYPELSREIARGNWAAVRQLLRQGSLLAGGFTLAAGLFLLVFGRPLISLLYTPEFLPSYPAVLILLAGFLVANTFYWHRVTLLALGRPDFPTKVNLALAVVKLAGIFWLVPRFGFLANASLLAGSYVLGVSVSAWKARRLLAQRELEATA